MAVDNSAEISRLNSEIQANNNQINQCRAQIDQNYRDIEDLRTMLTHYSSLGDTVRESSNGAVSLINRLPECISAGILNMGHFLQLKDSLKGGRFSSAVSSIENAKQKISSQINKLQQETEQLNSRITDCYKNVSMINENINTLESEQEND